MTDDVGVTQEMVDDVLRPVQSHDSTASHQPNMPNDDSKQQSALDVEEILTEAFVFANLTKKFMQHKTDIIKRIPGVDELYSMNKGQFAHMLTEFALSMESGTKIYEIIQHNRNMQRMEEEEEQEIDEEELNTICINFSSGFHDESNHKYRVQLNDVELISHSPIAKTATIEIDAQHIDSFNESQSSVHNPLIILLGISEYDGVHCCQQLIDVKYDMLALRTLFTSMYGTSNICHRNDRMYWTAKQCIDFFEYQITNKLVHQQLNKLKEEFDGVIVLIASYFKNNHIYSSDEHAINLKYIYQCFGEKYSCLLSLPRLFIVNTYPITSDYFYHVSKPKSPTTENVPALAGRKSSSSVSSRSKFRKSLSRSDSAYRPMDSKHDNGQRRMTIFGQSYHGNRIISYNIGKDKDSAYNAEQEGASLFYRAVIQSFKQAVYGNNDSKSPNEKKRKYTPYVAKIVDAIKDNLKRLYFDYRNIAIEDFNHYNAKFEVDSFEDVELEPFTYRIGDVQFMNHVKYNKCSDVKEQDEEKKDGSDILSEFHVNKKIMAYLYKNTSTGQYCNVSNLSLSEINSKLSQEEIEAGIPIAAKIEALNISHRHHHTLYKLKLRDTDGISVQLRSIGGSSASVGCFKHKMYGDLKKAKSEYRYLKISVRNDSKKYVLTLDENNAFLDCCEYLELPLYSDLPPNYEHSYLMVGATAEQQEFYDCMAKLGVMGCVQYIVSDAQSAKDTNMRFVIAFNGVDSNNKLKDLQFPVMDCWYVEKSQVNAKQFLSTLHGRKSEKKKTADVECRSTEPHCAFFRFLGN